MSHHLTLHKYIILFSLYIIAVEKLSAQHSRIGEYNGHVKYESTPKEGTLTVISTGFGKKIGESTKDANRGAFYTLLFRGIPGSQYELPMVPDENEKKDHPAVKRLLEDGYNAFVIEDVQLDQENKTKKQDGIKGKMTEHRITIDCDALRRYLEKNSVIRKFGY